MENFCNSLHPVQNNVNNVCLLSKTKIEFDLISFAFCIFFVLCLYYTIIKYN